AGTTRVGCSRLKCRHCGRRVRRITGYRIDRWPTTEDEIGEVWAAVDDPSACRFLTTAASGAEFSTYVCRCAVFDVSGIRSLRDIDTLDGWRCDGHPA
ncbi:MAG: hypothetical protein KC656_27805, partial [Myxococcales bacterium]|nr:hypothetical protein [Myxococcales bacterium]